MTGPSFRPVRVEEETRVLSRRHRTSGQLCSWTKPAVLRVVTPFGEVGFAVELRTLLRLWKSGGDRTEVLRSSVVAAWCAGLWSTCTFPCFFSFAQQGRSGHGGLASPHGASEIATLLFFFLSPAVGQEVALSGTTCAAFLVVLEARRRREPPAHHRCPCHLLRRVFLGSLLVLLLAVVPSVM